ncbi:MAG: hypothetical protein WAN74_05650 [Thermoplasmata archaeon]
MSAARSLASTIQALEMGRVAIGKAKTGPRQSSDPQVVRYKIAVLVTVAYIVMLFSPIVMIWTGKLSEADGVDLLKTIAAVFGGPVGAVIGFYFSSSSKPTNP